MGKLIFGVVAGAALYCYVAAKDKATQAEPSTTPKESN